MNDSKYVALSNGAAMPRLGLGVMFIEDADMQNIVDTAIDSGYRLFDTAALYGNEASLGAAIKANGIPRDQVFVSTKLRNRDQKYEDALKAFDLSLKTLGLDYLDMYLIHWPCPEYDLYPDAWKALEHLCKQGYVRNIGVSNFHQEHIDRILGMCDIPPVINQIECNPYLQVRQLREYCLQKGIQAEAWFPLGGPAIPAKGEQVPGKALMEDESLISIGKKHHKSAAQIALRWEIQSGIIAIPKSSNPGRVRENIEIFDFELSPDDMEAIAGMECGRRVGPDPDTLNEQF